MSVVVVLLRKAEFNSRESVIRNAFRGSTFDIHYMDGTTNSLEDAIKYSHSKGPKKYSIVISDTMTTQIRSEEMEKFVKDTVRTMTKEKIDLCYLNRYLDQCQMMTPVDNDDPTTDLYRTYAPRGDDCILYSPNARKELMKKHKGRDICELVLEGEFNALATTPSIFHFSLDCATSIEHYERSCECVPLQKLAAPVESGTNTSFIYFFFAVLLIIIATWALLYVGPKK